MMDCSRSAANSSNKCKFTSRYLVSTIEESDDSNKKKNMYQAFEPISIVVVTLVMTW